MNKSDEIEALPLLINGVALFITLFFIAGYDANLYNCLLLVTISGKYMNSERNPVGVSERM